MKKTGKKKFRAEQNKRIGRYFFCRTALEIIICTGRSRWPRARSSVESINQWEPSRKTKEKEIKRKFNNNNNKRIGTFHTFYILLSSSAELLAPSLVIDGCHLQRSLRIWTNQIETMAYRKQSVRPRAFHLFLSLSLSLIKYLWLFQEKKPPTSPKPRNQLNTRSATGRSWSFDDERHHRTKEETDIYTNEQQKIKRLLRTSSVQVPKKERKKGIEENFLQSLASWFPLTTWWNRHKAPTAVRVLHPQPVRFLPSSSQRRRRRRRKRRIAVIFCNKLSRAEEEWTCQRRWQGPAWENKDFVYKTCTAVGRRKEQQKKTWLNRPAADWNTWNSFFFSSSLFLSSSLLFDIISRWWLARTERKSWSSRGVEKIAIRVIFKRAGYDQSNAGAVSQIQLNATRFLGRRRRRCHLRMTTARWGRLVNMTDIAWRVVALGTNGWSLLTMGSCRLR